MPLFRSRRVHPEGLTSGAGADSGKGAKVIDLATRKSDTHQWGLTAGMFIPVVSVSY
jgi:hypothetical protein